MHLWVKYDTDEQIEKVRQVLSEIIRSCCETRQGKPGRQVTSPPPYTPQTFTPQTQSFTPQSQSYRLQYASQSQSFPPQSIAPQSYTSQTYNSQPYTSPAHTLAPDTMQHVNFHSQPQTLQPPSLQPQTLQPQTLQPQTLQSQASATGRWTSQFVMENCLPAKPTLPPTSPMECFFTLHYLAHAMPNLTTRGFDTVYENFFGYPLEERFVQGSLLRCLALIPHILKIEPVPKEDGIFFVRPALPKNVQWANFQTQIRSAPPSAPRPPPPPPVGTPPTPMYMSTRPVPVPLPANLPSPSALLVQAVHAMLTRAFMATIAQEMGSTAAPTLVSDRLKRWPGMSIHQVCIHCLCV